MIPIIYDMNETAFTSNGLGRLRDAISVTVIEERNGVYECNFEYPLNGANYDLIQVGRIIGVTHDDSGDVQPFDIVSFSKPIDGIVTFHCVHISYRQSYLTVTGSNINSLSEAFSLLTEAQPSNPFSYQTDKTSAGYVGAIDGLPKTVRSILGGMEGSILDVYGGEYEWDKWSVILHSARGKVRDFSIRYGVNLLDYNEDYNIEGTYSSVIPYWTDGTEAVIGNMVSAYGDTVTGRNECVPLDLSDRFEEKPSSQAEVEDMAVSYMNENNTFMPTQNIHVEFIRLQDMSEFADFSNLLSCRLCDTINVIFPDYNASGQFKIVRTVWDALANRYESMELGNLQVTLAEALGVTTANEKLKDIIEPDDYITEAGKSGDWYYRKYASGIQEAIYHGDISYGATSASGNVYKGTGSINLPSNVFSGAPLCVDITVNMSNALVFAVIGTASSGTAVNFQVTRSTNSTNGGTISATIRATYIPS